MKRTTIIAGLSMFLLFIAGCSKQPLRSEKSKPDVQTLLTRLSDFNQKQASTYSTARGKCTGFWGCLGYVVKVAGADIGGAAAGVVAVKEAATAIGITTGGTGAAAVIVGAGVVVGASASITAAYTQNANTPGQLQYGDIRIDPQMFNYIEVIGTEHNNVLHNNFYNGASLEEYYASRGWSDRETRAVKTAVQNVSLQVNDAAKRYAANFDFRSYSQELLSGNLISQEEKDILDVFMDAYVEVETKEDVQIVVNHYINEVANSSLDDDTKEVLVAGFIVASQSPFYFLDNFK